MSDTTTTTNGVNLPAPLAQIREQLPVLLQTHLPWMKEKHDAADALLESITMPTNSEEREDVIAKLAGVSKVFTAIQDRRKQMTEITDAFKDEAMKFERPFDTKAGAKSKYQEKRKLVEEYDQQELEKKQKFEAEVAKRKEVENLKVDLRAKMLENLSNMVINAVKRVDSGSKDYFDAATVEDFDKKAEAYKNNRPKLKQTEYDGCFLPTYGNPPGIITAEDLGLLIEDVKKEETFEKWNTAFVEAISPIINQWRALIPDLKQQKIQLQEAQTKSAEEAKKLQEEQQKKNDEAFQQRQTQLDAVAKEQQTKIQEEADTNKTMNELQSQASMWGSEAGPTKLVLKFTEMKEMPKAFMAIIYHSMAHPDFPGIQKRDAKKKLMTDDKGRPVYIEAIQWWIDFFLKNCNADVPNTKVFEDAKTTIR